MPTSVARDLFIRALAEYLAGPHQVEMSLGLARGKPETRLWARMRQHSPLFGYPTVDEAEDQLRRFLCE